jgi:hypothetical protein
MVERLWPGAGQAPNQKTTPVVGTSSVVASLEKRGDIEQLPAVKWELRGSLISSFERVTGFANERRGSSSSKYPPQTPHTASHFALRALFVPNSTIHRFSVYYASPAPPSLQACTQFP